MLSITRYFNLLLAFILCLLSAIALCVNHYLTAYPGNNYFPAGTLQVASILLLIMLGTYLLFDKNSPWFKIAQELVYFFLVISVIAFATNAIQFTPFKPIDTQLINADRALGIYLDAIVAWVINKPLLTQLLVFSYDSLPFQICYLPLMFILGRKFSYLREFYSLLLLTAMIGFVIYYFWPSVGPASSIGGPYFTTAQYATGLKFEQIHHRISPTTMDGGMIAMPSFHMIWALLCLNLSRCWPILFVLLVPLNLLLIASCLLLGWHYLIDLIGSVFVLMIAFIIYHLIEPWPKLLTKPEGLLRASFKRLVLTFR